jgi:hypothetical protein
MRKKNDKNEPRPKSLFVFVTYHLGLPLPGSPCAQLLRRATKTNHKASWLVSLCTGRASGPSSAPPPCGLIHPLTRRFTFCLVNSLAVLSIHSRRAFDSLAVLSIRSLCFRFARCAFDSLAVLSIRSLCCRFARCTVDSLSVLSIRLLCCRFARWVVHWGAVWSIRLLRRRLTRRVVACLGGHFPWVSYAGVAPPSRGNGGGGDAGSGCCMAVKGVSGGLRKEGWDKTGPDKCRCPFAKLTTWAPST